MIELFILNWVIGTTLMAMVVFKKIPVNPVVFFNELCLCAMGGFVIMPVFTVIIFISIISYFLNKSKKESV